jgi:hypothetical protein
MANTDAPNAGPGTSTPLGRKPRSLTRRLVGAVVIVLVMCIIIPFVVLATAGPSLWNATIPTFANTTQKLQRANLMRAYRSPTDPSIDAIRAGEAFHGLGARPGVKNQPYTRPATRGPITLPVPDAALFPNARPEFWVGPSPTRILESAHKGLSRAEMDYLAALAANPAWEDYGVVAHAKRMDLAAGTYIIPLPADISAFELPLTRFAATKEMAYANNSRAAWYLASGKPADADRVLRETISNGFRLIDDGNTLIDDLIGVVIVGIGRNALEQLYALTKNPELARIQADSAAFDKAHQTAAKAATPDRATVIKAVTDTTQARGLRMELVMALSTAKCTSVREVMFGAGSEITTALDAARGQLARSTAEGALFDLNARVVESAPSLARNLSGAGPNFMIGLSKVPAFLLHNPRISNCTTLLIGMSAMN